MDLQRLRVFGADQNGGVILVFVLAAPILMGGVAAATEYGLLIKRRQQMQAAVDQAATMGANQFLLANADEATIKSFAESTAIGLSVVPTGRAAVATATPVKTETRVQVSMVETVPTVMGKLLRLPTADIRVRASAKLSGSIRLCLLALDPSAAGALHLEKNAIVTADDCSTYSNSKSPKGLQAGDGARLTTRSSCSAGGVDGASANFIPMPTKDCPQVKDPLADRAAPDIGSCISLSSIVNSDPTKITNLLKRPSNEVNQSVTLDPGTYCGGLKITKNAVVTLRPGVYVMKDGPLIVDGKASMSGQNVGFYFTGDRGGLRFDKDTTISLTAPKDGAMAGLLMFEDRSVSLPVVPPLDTMVPVAPPPPGPATKPLREYRIISDNARTMLGTIYLPAGRLIVDAQKPVADQSAYTVIVAQLVNLYDGPNLVLNARYSQTDIPVPKGVGPTSGTTALTQ